MEFSLLGAAAAGLAGMYVVLRWEAGGGNAAESTRSLWDLLLTAAIVGLAVGRVASMLGGGSNPLTHPADILIVRGGVDTRAAAAAALLTAVVLARRDLMPTLDAAAPAALAGLAGWQAGCLARGACLGTPTGLPWGMPQPGSAIGRHPVELYAALLLVVGVVALMAWKRRRPPPGTITGVALGWAGAVRLVTEPLRLGIGGGPEWWYGAGIALGCAVAAWGLLRRRTKPDGPAQP
ncbi:MAG: prolipoprotein diacylglyceryl transferase family protein [Actinomycetota bacterium]